MSRRMRMAAAAAGLLIVGVAGGILMGGRAGDNDGEMVGNTGFVNRVVENLGMDKDVVRDAVDGAKQDEEDGGKGTFASRLAENLDLEESQVRNALDRAKRETLRERVRANPGSDLG